MWLRLEKEVKEEMVIEVLKRVHAGDKTILLERHTHGGLIVCDELKVEERQEDYTIYKFFDSDDMDGAERYFKAVVREERRRASK